MIFEEREQLRERMLNALERTREEIAALEEGARTVDLDQPIGRLSRMDSLANQAIASKVLAEARSRLLRLERALSRIEDEDYGFCEECGETIPLGRLLALPDTRFCVRCAP